MIVGCDVGGTFTDTILVSKGEIKVSKVLTTPNDYAEGVIQGIQKLGAPYERVIHGMTVGTNAVLQRRGAVVTLIVNKGFRDILEIGRQNRPSLYDFSRDRLPPLVPRSRRIEVSGRITSSGEVIEDLQEEVDIPRGTEAVAVCLLHSYANPSHERRLKSMISLPVCISSDILPEFREYERMSTSVINAYVMPVIDRYLSNLEQRIAVPLMVIESSGGIMTAHAAREKPVHTVLSGPAGGVIASQFIGTLLNVRNLITLDMGGTSTDISLLRGEPTLTTEGSIERYPLRIPMIDIHTIGAGGGSIAWLDEGGALRVGPQSAEADPGPACYRKGGVLPTVTDANVILGRLGLQLGEIALDKTTAERSMRDLCSKTGFDEVEMAAGIVKVANATMCQGVRVVSVERGHDPRDFVLLAFGGAGPLHACELAEELSIPRVLIPVYPGVFSALGMVVADIRHEFALTQRMPLGGDPENVFRKLEEKAVTALKKEGVSRENIVIERIVDMRYVGQSYELRIPAENAVYQFHETHRKMYGYADPSWLVEYVTFRVVGIGRSEKISLKRLESGEGERGPPVITVRDVFFNGFERTSIYTRNLKWGHTIYGPAVIEEMGSTTLVPPGWVMRADEYGNLLGEVV